MHSQIIVEPYRSILRYFFPEFMVAFVLYTLVGLIDAQCVAYLKSTACYASLGVTNTLIFFINKLAEGVSVGAVIMCGQYQGQKNYEMVGKSAVAAFWATVLIGFSIAAFLYFNAGLLYRFLQIPEAMASEGVPFLQTRAIGIAFMFIFSALIGFLRGVKNTRAVMYFFVLGAFVFVFFDYALIFGAFGFAPRGFQGSAIAFALQYIVMFCAAIIYIVSKKEYRIYNFRFFRVPWALLKPVFSFSWPVTFDKAALQIERIWLLRLIAPMGSVALGGLNVIRDMEALAFVPAIAFGHVVTLLASNNFGARQFQALKKTTIIIIVMAVGMVAMLLGIIMLNLPYLIGLFDRQHAFSDFAIQVFPVAAVLLFFDLFQVLLAGALRGTGNVQLVMWVRVLSAVVLFIPLSYLFSLLPFTSVVLKFIVVYGSFNLVNGITTLVYAYWFRSGRWLKQEVLSK
jgi:putative MATE family efflux protein